MWRLEMHALSTGFRTAPSLAWAFPAIIAISIFNTVHLASTFAVETIIITTETGPTPGTASRPLVVPRQGVTSGKAPPALVTDVGPFTSVELCVALQIVQSAKARLTRLADVWLLLAVRQ